MCLPETCQHLPITLGIKSRFLAMVYKPCILTPDYVSDLHEAQPSCPLLTQSGYIGLPCAPQTPTSTLMWKELTVPSRRLFSDSCLVLSCYCPTLSPLSGPLPHTFSPWHLSLPETVLLICRSCAPFLAAPFQHRHPCCCIPRARGVPYAQ